MRWSRALQLACNFCRLSSSACCFCFCEVGRGALSPIQDASFVVLARMQQLDAVLFS